MTYHDRWEQVVFPEEQQPTLEEPGELYVANCIVCGEPIDYCLGHGAFSDPTGAAILRAHDRGDHQDCHTAGCDAAAEEAQERLTWQG